MANMPSARRRGRYILALAGVIVAGAALAFCYTVEIAKLDQAPWLVAFRYTTAGGLLLGHVFTPANFACYAVGIAIGILLDLALTSRPAPARAI